MNPMDVFTTVIVFTAVGYGAIVTLLFYWAWKKQKVTVK